MKTEQELEIEKLRKQRNELFALLREVLTAHLAAGWREDHLERKIKDALKDAP